MQKLREVNQCQKNERISKSKRSKSQTGEVSAENVKKTKKEVRTARVGGYGLGRHERPAKANGVGRMTRKTTSSSRVRAEGERHWSR